MQKTGIKKGSKQRDAILRVLQGTVSHPTADWIYDRVREEIPSISLGTVYRNLAVLTESGIILKLDVGDGTDHFDANSRPHYHLFCQTCKNVIDIRLPYIENLNKKAEETDNVRVNMHGIIFYGLCPNCLLKNNN